MNSTDKRAAMKHQQKKKKNFKATCHTKKLSQAHGESVFCGIISRRIKNINLNFHNLSRAQKEKEKTFIFAE